MTIKTKNRHGTTTRPKLEDFADVVDARANAVRLHASHRKALDDHQAAVAAITERARQDEGRVQRLIAGGDLDESDGVDLQSARRKAADALRIYAKAIHAHAKELSRIEGSRSHDICKAVEPEFRALSQVVVDRIVEALGAFDLVRQLQADLASEGVLSVGDYLPHLEFEADRLQAWLAKVRKNGYDVPELPKF